MYSNINNPRLVDFDKIYDALRCGIETECKGGDAILTSSPVSYIKELRTIGIRSARQTGKTTWALKKTAESDAILLLCNRDELSTIKQSQKYAGRENLFYINDFVNGQVKITNPVTHVFIDGDIPYNETLVAGAIYESFGINVTVVHISS